VFEASYNRRQKSIEFRQSLNKYRNLSEKAGLQTFINSLNFSLYIVLSIYCLVETLDNKKQSLR